MFLCNPIILKFIVCISKAIKGTRYYWPGVMWTFCRAWHFLKCQCGPSQNWAHILEVSAERTQYQKEKWTQPFIFLISIKLSKTDQNWALHALWLCSVLPNFTWNDGLQKNADIPNLTGRFENEVLIISWFYKMIKNIKKNCNVV